MKIIADTNIIIRLIVNAKTDLQQAEIAARLIDDSEEIIIPTHVFCEIVWVLSSVYRLDSEQISTAIKSLLNLDRLTIKEDEIEAGLAMLEKGGDFADGVNAYAGQTMAHGLPVFVSFDKQAVRLLIERGLSAMVPA